MQGKLFRALYHFESYKESTFSLQNHDTDQEKYVISMTNVALQS